MFRRVVDQGDGAYLLQIVERITITPDDVTAIVDGYVSQCRKQHAGESEWRTQSRAADKIIQRYSRYAMMVGGATGIPRSFPGLVSLLSSAGAALADAAICMKLQVDMCMCLAHLYGKDVTTEQGRYLAFLIAATGSMQQQAIGPGARLGSEADADALQSYIRGVSVQAAKQAFRKACVTFVRRAFRKAMPLGLGAVIGGGTNYALTRYVGQQAKQWFIIDSAALIESAHTMNGQQESPKPGLAAGP